LSEVGLSTQQIISKLLLKYLKPPLCAVSNLERSGLFMLPENVDRSLSFRFLMSVR
jgi:hypothetical protein